jgi:hypothetical protein
LGVGVPEITASGQDGAASVIFGSVFGWVAPFELVFGWVRSDQSTPQIRPEARSLRLKQVNESLGFTLHRGGIDDY